MKYKSFEEYWQTEMTGKFGTVPAMELAFKEVAEKAWNAAKQSSESPNWLLYPNGESFFESPNGKRIYGSAARKIKFRKTGEYRAPRKGDWYLSGAIPCGFCASQDFLGDRYHILEAVYE